MTKQLHIERHLAAALEHCTKAVQLASYLRDMADGQLKSDMRMVSRKAENAESNLRAALARVPKGVDA